MDLPACSIFHPSYFLFRVWYNHTGNVYKRVLCIDNVFLHGEFKIWGERRLFSRVFFFMCLHI